MTTEIKVPQLPESVADATIITWHKKAGDFVEQDENLLELETDKVVIEVPAPASGRLVSIACEVDAVVKTDEVLAILEEGAAVVDNAGKVNETANAPLETGVDSTEPEAQPSRLAELFSGPATRRVAKKNNIALDSIEGTGKSGRITPEDVMQKTESSQKINAVIANTQVTGAVARQERNTIERVPMPRLRAKIAERLLAAKQETALLTTFNEVDLGKVIEIRNNYKVDFEKKHGVRLGFMSFFTKAAIEALKQFPIVNAAIDGNDIVYHHHYDIGIAVSTERGLVVPIIRNADQLGFAEIEKSINDYAKKARDGKLSINELTGGTFTITNGGVFGSLLSTPIINPPQSAILGMHTIQKRPVVDAETGAIVIRPMMYLALSYDHRIIDGRESVLFLATIKKCLEDPSRLLLGL